MAPVDAEVLVIGPGRGAVVNENAVGAVADADAVTGSRRAPHADMPDDHIAALQAAEVQAAAVKGDAALVGGGGAVNRQAAVLHPDRLAQVNDAADLELDDARALGGDCLPEAPRAAVVEVRHPDDLSALTADGVRAEALGGHHGRCPTGGIVLAARRPHRHRQQSAEPQNDECRRQARHCLVHTPTSIWQVPSAFAKPASASPAGGKPLPFVPPSQSSVHAPNASRPDAYVRRSRAADLLLAADTAVLVTGPRAKGSSPRRTPANDRERQHRLDSKDNGRPATNLPCEFGSITSLGTENPARE